MLQQIKTLLGIQTEEQDAVIEQLLGTNRVLVSAYVRVPELLVESEPLLRNVVIEMTVERFNRLGAEGLNKEVIEGHERNFTADGLLERHLPVLELYLSQQGEVSPKRRLRTL